MSHSVRTVEAAQVPQSIKTFRTVMALILREIATTYGRSALGYLWAVIEPVAGIMLLTFVFSQTFRAPPIGTSFPLFYASGMLPFLAYLDLSQKISVSVRFSKPLLFYPGVTFIDAILARLLLNAFTHLMVFAMVLGSILIFYRVDSNLDLPAMAEGFLMMVALSAGIGTLNCFLLSRYPVWERAWAILNRPLFIISCVFFMFESVPVPYRDYLWWNPLVHLVGQFRSGVYPTYDDSYVSPLYVFGLSLVTFTVGILLLRRFYRDIIND
jgi:capsular polysaccharide transport system permease protein